MIRNTLFMFSSQLKFRANYGQAGILSFNFNKPGCQYNVTLNTIWEDYTDVNVNFNHDDKGEKWLLEENHQNSLLTHLHSDSSNPFYDILVEIPEYYSYQGIINGNLIHKKALIDAKIYGDIDIQVNQFQANKIKSASARILSNQSIKVDKYLEAQRAELVSKSENIEISRLGLSGVGRFEAQKGTIKIGSHYTDLQDEAIRVPRLDNYEEQVEWFKNKFEEQSNSWVQCKEMKITFFHGALQGEGLQSVNLMSVSRGLLKLLNCEGNINLGMIQDYCNGIIETSGQIIINTSRCFEHNIYLKKLDKDNGEFIDEFKSEKPSLYLYCSDLVMI